MPNHVSGQKFVADPAIGYPGDRRGVNQWNDTMGVIAGSLIAIGSFVWSVPDDSPRVVTQTKSDPKAALAGFVVRDGAGVYDWNNYQQGYNMQISDGRELAIIPGNATVYALVTSLNTGAVVNYGDGVYVKDNDANGINYVSASDPGAGYTATGYKVIQANIPNAFPYFINDVETAGPVPMALISNFESI